MEEKKEVLSYYGKPGEITDISKYSSFIKWLPDDPNVIGQVVQGLIVHDSWFTQYDEPYDESHEYPQKTAYMEDILDKALDLDKCNLAVPRHPRDRVIACCREFATLMCAFFRAKGIPARARCGFALYFGWDGNYEDHWICEFWNGVRWVRWDPQLDPLQQSFVLQWGMENKSNENRVKQMKEFNPHDLKADEFITAGEAWKLCRSKQVDSKKFGIGCEIQPEWGINSLHGLWFVRGQLLRDFAALNKVETVPYLVRICKKLDWKSWHLVGAKDEDITEEELKLLDDIAELSCNADKNFEEIQKLYHDNELLAVPSEIIER